MYSHYSFSNAEIVDVQFKLKSTAYPERENRESYLIYKFNEKRALDNWVNLNNLSHDFIIFCCSFTTDHYCDFPLLIIHFAKYTLLTLLIRNCGFYARTRKIRNFVNKSIGQKKSNRKLLIIIYKNYTIIHYINICFFYVNGVNLKKFQYLTFFNISSIILVIINLNLLIIYT